jgi:hypothetical protein
MDLHHHSGSDRCSKGIPQPHCTCAGRSGRPAAHSDQQRARGAALPPARTRRLGWITLALGNRLARFDPQAETFQVHELERFSS